MEFSTRSLPSSPDETAPDGSDVRVLVRTSRGSMAHFELACGRCSIAIQHRTVDELWYVLAGSAELWRKQGNREEIVTLTPGMSFSIPQGTRFQLRSTGSLAFAAIGVTMPPWSGPEEAVKVEGPWDAAHGRAAADDSTGTPQA